MLTCVASLTVLGSVLVPFACAQTPAANAQSLRFEVASLKPNRSGGGRLGIRPAPGGQRYVAANVSLKLLIMVAYRVKINQVTGGPDWIDNERYDLNAKAERPSTAEELHLMLQNLLAERFGLHFHRATKDLPVYLLSVDKGGPKLTPHEAGSAGDPWIDASQALPFHIKWSAKSVPMEYVAWRLGLALDRPVVDRTNLKGGYDFELSYTAEPPPNLPEGVLINGRPIDTSGPNVFEALRRQLGLRLEAQKGPVEIIIIDHAEKPMEN